MQLWASQNEIWRVASHLSGQFTKDFQQFNYRLAGILYRLFRPASGIID